MGRLFERSEPFVGKGTLFFECEIAKEGFDQRRHGGALRAGREFGLFDEVFFDGESELGFQEQKGTVDR